MLELLFLLSLHIMSRFCFNYRLDKAALIIDVGLAMVLGCQFLFIYL